MENTASSPSSALAAQLRQWIIIAGYALGGWALLETIVTSLGFGIRPLHELFDNEVMVAIHRVATLLYLVSPLILITGCWGFQRHLRWARPLLVTYACAWIAALFGMQVVVAINSLSGTIDQNTFSQSVWQHISLVAGSLELPMYGSVYAVFLLWCLSRPELRDQFSQGPRGFTPIVKDDTVSH